MSDLNLGFDYQRSPSILLRDLFQSAHVEAMALGDGRAVMNYRVAWPYSLDPFAAIDCSRDEWKVYWRTKQADQSHLQVFAMGQCLQVDSPSDRLIEKTKAVSWFVCLPFQSETSTDDWGYLARSVVFLPQAQWTINDKNQHIDLELRIVANQDLLEDSLALQERFVNLMREYLPLSLMRTFARLPSRLKETELCDYRRWYGSITEAKEEIKQGTLEKVVLSRAKKLELVDAPDIGSVLKGLSEIDEASYLFALVHPSSRSAFIGRSPESLLTWDRSSYYVDAIAGTRRRSENLSDDFGEASDLRTSEKDLIEHRHVTRFVESCLQEFGTHTQKIENENLLRLANVQHIRSRYRAVRNPKKLASDLLQAIHPTPAVGGFPRERACEYIRSHEPFKRGLFAGAIGWLSPDSGDIAIGIRSALLHNSQITIFAGSGIVEESDAKKEWQETELKMKNFLDLFPLAVRN